MSELYSKRAKVDSGETRRAERQFLEGEVFFPSPESVAQARIRNWEAIARYAAEDLEGF